MISTPARPVRLVRSSLISGDEFPTLERKKCLDSCGRLITTSYLPGASLSRLSSVYMPPFDLRSVAVAFGRKSCTVVSSAGSKARASWPVRAKKCSEPQERTSAKCGVLMGGRRGTSTSGSFASGSSTVAVAGASADEAHPMTLLQARHGWGLSANTRGLMRPGLCPCSTVCLLCTVSFFYRNRKSNDTYNKSLAFIHWSVLRIPLAVGEPHADTNSLLPRPAGQPLSK